MIGGLPFTLFMTTFIALLSYIFYFQSFRKHDPILIYLNLMFLTLGMLSFFGQYFTTFALYEMTGIFIVFILILKVLKTVERISEK
jgi:hypothetical protein